MALRPAAILAALLSSVPACSPAPRWIAVADSAGSAVLLLDGRLQPVRELPVSGPPAALESTGDGSSILVGVAAGADGGSLEWLRRADGATILGRDLPGPIRSLALDREGRRVLALTGGTRGGLIMLDVRELAPERAIPLCAEPVSLAFTGEGDRVYVTCAPGSVAEIDPRLNLLVRVEIIAADSGRACLAGRSVMSPSGTLLLVPCSKSGRLVYLDRVTLKPWDSLPLAPGISAVAVTPDGIGLVLQPDSDRVALVHLLSKRRFASVSTPPDPVDLSLSADAREAFVVASGRGGQPGTLLVIDTHTGGILNRMALPAGAHAVHVWPGERESRMSWAGQR